LAANEHDLDLEPVRVVVRDHLDDLERAGANPQLLAQLPLQRVLGALALLDLAAWQLPLEPERPARWSLREQQAAGAPHHGRCDADPAGGAGRRMVQMNRIAMVVHVRVLRVGRFAPREAGGKRWGLRLQPNTCATSRSKRAR